MKDLLKILVLIPVVVVGGAIACIGCFFVFIKSSIVLSEYNRFAVDLGGEEIAELLYSPLADKLPADALVSAFDWLDKDTIIFVAEFGEQAVVYRYSFSTDKLVEVGEIQANGVYSINALYDSEFSALILLKGLESVDYFLSNENKLVKVHDWYRSNLKETLPFTDYKDFCAYLVDNYETALSYTSEKYYSDEVYLVQGKYFYGCRDESVDYRVLEYLQTDDLGVEWENTTFAFGPEGPPGDVRTVSDASGLWSIRSQDYECGVHGRCIDTTIKIESTEIKLGTQYKPAETSNERYLIEGRGLVLLIKGKFYLIPFS